MGNEIYTLVNTIQTPGKYEVTFDATKLSPGIYIYNLTTNNISQTKRMMLLR